MLPSKYYNFVCTTARYVSTNSAKQSTAATVEAKDAYYHKIGTKVSELDSDVKPDGWDQAKPFKSIPGPKSYPIIGNFWRFLPVVGEYYKVELVEMHKRIKARYGNLAYIQGIPGQRPMLFAYDPDDIEMTLRNEGPWPIRFGLQSFVYYRSHVRRDVFQGVGGVLSVQGEEWFQFRSMVNKILMQPRTAEMYVNSMDGIADVLIDNMRYFSKNDPKHEMSADFQNELYKWALESIGLIAYNKRIGCLERDNKNVIAQQMISETVEVLDLMYRLDVLPSLWRLISTRNWRRYVKILDFLTEVNQKFIEECLANADPNPNIPDHERSVLERLVKQDKKVAVAMATDMVIAGVDTTGRTMGSALYFLAKHPETQHELRKELKKYMPNKNSPVTKEMLREAIYLKAVIKEITRMAPVSVGMLRTTVKDLVLSGYQVPKGTDIISSNLLPSLEDKYFIKAQEFIPERWLRTTNNEYSYKNTHPFVSLPFGFGPRSCIGKRLANLELEVGISKVIRNFNLSWHHPDAIFGSKLLYGIVSPLNIKVEEVET